MYHRRFDPFSSGFLGQDESSSWREKALAAVARYDAVLARADALPGDEKVRLYSFVGDGTAPGTPSDRYRFVRDSIVSDGPWDAIHQGYVQDLEDADVELESRVDQAERTGSSGGAGDFCRDFHGGGKAKHKHRAAFGLVVAGDLAAVILDNSVHGAESEAGAFADRLGGVERIENTLGLANARTGIGELQHDFAAVLLGRDAERAADDVHRVHCVLDDFDERLE